MSRVLTPFLLAAILAACGAPPDTNKDGISDAVRNPDSVTQVAPTTPVGTVSGVVVNTKFVGLDGVNVTLVLGGNSDGMGSAYKATTDAEGNFSFKNVPAGGTAQVTVSKAGYGSARTSVTVPASTGNFPLNNGNGNAGYLVLTELSGTVKFNVYSASGKPAKGARGLLEVTPAAFLSTGPGTYGSSQGVTSVDTVVDENGVLTFTGVPTVAEATRVGASYSVTIGALDEDGDGDIDSLGTSRFFAGSTLFTSPTQNIFLSDARTSATLAISAASVESLYGGSSAPFRNSVRPADAITVVFNQAVANQTLLVKVVQEDCATNVAVSVNQRAPNVLSISPATAWTVGARFNIVIRATGLESGSTNNFRGFFFSVDPTAPRPLGTTAAFQVRKAPGNNNTSALQPNDELYATFDTPITFLGGTQARAFFNYDLNGNGTIGGMGDVGEYNTPFTSGYQVDIAEQTFDATNSTFTCRASGYASRYRITFGALPAGGVPMMTDLKVTIPKDASASTGYQTAWGQPFTGDITGRMMLAP